MMLSTQIPIPKPVVGASSRQGIAFLALAQCLFRFLERHLRADARQSDGEIDWLRKIVVGTQVQCLDNVLALVSSPSP